MMVVAQFVKGINEEIDKLVRIRELISLEYGEQGPTPEEMVKRRVAQEVRGEMADTRTIVIDGRICKLCRFCDCPMKPKGVRKKPNFWDHAQRCPYSRHEHNNNNKRRHFSKAARHKMAMAQKARWALLKGKK